MNVEKFFRNMRREKTDDCGGIFPGNVEEAIVYLMAGSGNTANSSTRSYGMSLMRALQPSSGKRVRLARRNI